jgi:hypothetical protein
MSPIFSGLGAMVTTLGTAATAGAATGVTAGIVGSAILGGGVAALASDIKNLVSGNYPWEDPGKFFGDHIKAAGMGAATSAVGSAIGPALGAAGEALGIAANTGTIPAAAGAPSGAVDLGGNLAKEATSLLGSGTSPTSQGFSKAVESALPGLAKTTVGGAATGAARDYRNPLRGALGGAASGIATGVFNMGTNAAFRGMDNGFFAPDPKLEIGFKMQPPGPQDYSLLRSPSVGPQASMQMNTPEPQLGGRVLGAAARMGGNMAGSAARMGVSNAMTPPPPTPPQNPYGAFGVTPYWMRQGFR